MHFAIILVRPQLPRNIGAIARVIKNFSCTDLRIINPKTSFITDQSTAIAVDAVDVLQNSKTYGDLDDAVKDLHEVYAFTARKRFMNKPSVKLADFALSNNTAKIGLMFGPENSGLSNEDIAIAKKQIFIDTNDNFSSLNLSHAVAIALYHLTKNVKNQPENTSDQKDLATLNELNGFFNHLEKSLLTTDFLKIPEKRRHMLLNIKNIFSRTENITSQEVRTLRGILTAFNNNS